MRQVLAQRHKYAEAREQIERLLALDPANPDYRALAATAAVGLGEHATAPSRSIAACSPTRPARPIVHLWLGHALKTVGRLPEAIDAYRAAAAARPDFGDAYWSLANLKTYRFTDDEIARMRAEEACADDRAGGSLSTSASRSARRWRTAARRPSPGATTSAATR